MLNIDLGYCDFNNILAILTKLNNINDYFNIEIIYVMIVFWNITFFKRIIKFSEF